MTPTWPPRWTEPHFKTGVTSRVKKRQTKATQRIAVDKKKGDVRKRDRKCRFPMCGCAKLKIQPHVSHQHHAGMGGNPAGDRSAPELMIYVCACRHRENRISIDKGTLRWRELETGKGANGRVAWDIRTSELPKKWQRQGPRRRYAEWTTLWIETEIGKGFPLTGFAVEILKWLATMEV